MGLSVEEVEILLACMVKLSRLHTTEKKEILPEDFDRKEVRMDTLTKAVFLLYLNHPEGIRYKERPRGLPLTVTMLSGNDD